MNVLLLVSGGLATFMVLGHSTLGRKQFFLPMLEASFDPTAKRIMAFVWHMSTATLVAAAAALIYAGLIQGDGAAVGVAGRPLTLYIGLQFLAYGAVHLFLVSTSKLPGAVYKQFQWSLFFAVGLTAWAGA
jgi:hypothetical protein